MNFLRILNESGLRSFQRTSELVSAFDFVIELAEIAIDPNASYTTR